MGLRFIRQPSDEPNISNADDARMIRYSYGGYNGFVKGKGAELSATPSGSTFKINSGVVVLHGYETEIDSNGWEITIANTPTKRYFSVWYEVNLAAQTVKIDSTYDTAGFPTVQSGDDLTSASTGTARLLLYQFTATNGVIDDIAKKVEEIKYNKTLIEAEKTAREDADTEIRDDIADGTITAYKSQRDGNGAIIPDTYRKKNERVLFFEGEFQSNLGVPKTLTRNIGSAAITSNSFVEIEFGFGSADASYEPAYKRRQVIRVGNSTIFEAGIAAASIMRINCANVQFQNSSSIYIQSVQKFEGGAVTSIYCKIYKIWVVE